MNKIKRIFYIIILIIIFLEIKSISGYLKKINLKVCAQIAKPVFCVNHDEKIEGYFSNINSIPEYNFEISNFNEKNEISEIDLNVNLKIQTENQIQFKIINLETNEIILDNNKKEYNIILPKDILSLYKYKIIIETKKTVIKEKFKIYINSKYYKYELEVFDFNLDTRELEYKIYMSETNKKYTNQNIEIQIQCNKQINKIQGFNLSENKLCLSKIYTENTLENIILEDLYGNKKNIEISINKIDKQIPEIVGVEENQIYSKGLKLIYKDNIGIKNITIENKTKRKSNTVSFDLENKIIESQVLVVKNDSINPYYLNQDGEYTIIVTDFAENKLVRHITIK